jgi:hypothetical protein
MNPGGGQDTKVERFFRSFLTIRSDRCAVSARVPVRTEKTPGARKVRRSRQ